MLLPNLGVKRSRWKTALWLALIGGAVALLFLIKPLYQHLRVGRAEKMAAQAEQLAAAGQWKEAAELAQSARQLHAGNVRAARVMARVLTHFQQEEAFAYWSLSWAGNPPPAADRREVIELALKLRRLDVAEFYLKDAIKQTPLNNEILRLAAGFCDLRGDRPRAIQFARLYLQRQPASAEMQFLLARQLLAVRQPAEAREARALLWSIVRANPTNTPPALGVLATLADLSREEIEECIQRVQAIPSPDQGRDLLLRDLQVRLEPEKRAGLIAEAVAKFQHSTPAERLILARWLNQRREFPRVLEILPLETALSGQDFLLVYLDAMAGLGRWEELEKILFRDKLSLDPVLVELYRARTAMELKKDRQAGLHWSQAQNLAATNSAALWHVAEYAEKTGETDEAIKAYRKLARDQRHAQAAYAALIRLAEQKGNTPELRRLMQELVERYPDDPAPRNDLAYLDLLLRENISTAKSVSEKLAAQHPRLLAYRTTLALACLRLDDPPGAKAAYQDAQIEWNQALPGWQAVYVAVVGAGGNTNLARQLAPTIPLHRLKPEERALVQPWL